jgi:hypothetical protein
MFAQLGVKPLELRHGRQLTVQQQIGRFFKSAVLGQVDNSISTVGQDALLAIQIGNI